MRWTIAWLALGMTACDVEASLGAHDAAALDGGLDAPVADADTIDASAIDAGAIDDAGMCVAPDADACMQCQATVCCPVYTPCQAATNCRCIVDCVLTGRTVAACTTHCGADHGESTAMLQCAQNHCPCP